ncbi:MmpS family transport accessory protein [Nocardia sp. NPDC003345]
MTHPPGDQIAHRGPREHPGRSAGDESPGRPPKRPRWPWAAGAAVLLFGVLAGAGPAVQGLRHLVVRDAAPALTVTYRVEGTGSGVSISYLGHDLGMAREIAAAVPWTKDVPVLDLGKIVSLTATNSAHGGDITCRILVAGRVLSEQTSTGPYASAGCSGDADSPG